MHCGRFSTAASRRSLGSVSVPVSRATLSRPVAVIALVSFYPTNKLIAHRPLLYHRSFQWECLTTPHLYRVLAHVSMSCSRVQGKLSMRYSPVCHFPYQCKHRYISFDLHALDMPPAFDLSQDQTLKKSFLKRIRTFTKSLLYL